MDKISKIEKGSFFEYCFFCDGCGNAHGFRTDEWEEPIGLTKDQSESFKSKWSFNGDFVKPTITPSILIHHIDENGIKTIKCHSYVKDGMIQYLPDCKHKLAGKTVPLQDF